MSLRQFIGKMKIADELFYRAYLIHTRVIFSKKNSAEHQPGFSEQAIGVRNL
jgi:hypothetical protein